MLEVTSLGEILLGGRLWAVWGGFHLLSWSYNGLIDYLHWREFMSRWTWLTVVVGVGYTLAACLLAVGGLVVTGGTAVAVFVLLFVATGTPMIVGDIWRVVAWEANGNNVTGAVLGGPDVSESGDNNGEPA